MLKKLTFLLLLFLVFAVGLVTATEDFCTDPDGSNTYTATSISFYDPDYFWFEGEIIEGPDYCMSHPGYPELLERECDGNAPYYTPGSSTPNLFIGKYYFCKWGCFEGRCLANDEKELDTTEYSSSINDNYYTYCFESDNGNDATHAGTAFGKFNGVLGVKGDACINSNTLKEYSCTYDASTDEEVIVENTVSCTSGTICSDGRCVESSQTDDYSARKIFWATGQGSIYPQYLAADGTWKSTEYFIHNNGFTQKQVEKGPGDLLPYMGPWRELAKGNYNALALCNLVYPGTQTVTVENGQTINAHVKRVVWGSPYYGRMHEYEGMYHDLEMTGNIYNCLPTEYVYDGVTRVYAKQYYAKVGGVYPTYYYKITDGVVEQIIAPGGNQFNPSGSSAKIDSLIDACMYAGYVNTIAVVPNSEETRITGTIKDGVLTAYACITDDSKTCTDSDSGNKPYQYGKVNGWVQGKRTGPDFLYGQVEDSCTSGALITEAYCDGLVVKTRPYYDRTKYCANGAWIDYACSDPSSKCCDDPDGGVNPSLATSVPYWSGDTFFVAKDHCLSNYRLSEHYCDGLKAKQTVIDGNLTGQTCVNGALVGGTSTTLRPTTTTVKSTTTTMQGDSTTTLQRTTTTALSSTTTTMKSATTTLRVTTTTQSTTTTTVKNDGQGVICDDIKDGGKKPYVAGITRGMLNGMYVEKEDYCEPGSTRLIEFYCTEENSVGSYAQTCSSGCQAGACVTSVTGGGGGADGEVISISGSGTTDRDVVVSGGSWTQWFDRDNPSGNGDYETIKDMTVSICSNPVEIQCVRVSDGMDWKLTGERYVCDRTVGGYCVNMNQIDGTCDDYKVRFYYNSPDQQRPCDSTISNVGCV